MPTHRWTLDGSTHRATVNGVKCAVRKSWYVYLWYAGKLRGTESTERAAKLAASRAANGKRGTFGWPSPPNRRPTGGGG